MTSRQIAALPYRIKPDGTAAILLITSRASRRWVIPKGNPMRGLGPHHAAAVEAFEEAGINGILCPTSLGTFDYDKKRTKGGLRPTRVEVFPLAVTTELSDWPEQDQRRRQWFDLADAVAAVDEPELKAIIRDFREPPPIPGITDRALDQIGTWATNKGAHRFPMVRWFQKIMPQQGQFFELFDAHAATLVAGADALAKLLQGGEAMAEHSKTIFDREEAADAITRQVLQDVRRTFVTPFDRSAITSLISSMDDAIDQMNRTAKAISMYDVTEFDAEMRDMAGIIVEAARVTAEAIPLLRSLGPNGSRLHLLTGRIVLLEGQADDIHDAGMKALFRRHSETAPMAFIVGQEIYTALEKVVDCFEDVANEIQGIVIDHA
ncbi:MAG: DUF47 domain-containing protein [Alphaproteobacteria bacterium]|nr:MAG: DUF47 domain-containing protein [Alphaproteobacteria bacterium]